MSAAKKQPPSQTTPSCQVTQRTDHKVIKTISKHCLDASWYDGGERRVFSCFTEHFSISQIFVPKIVLVCCGVCFDDTLSFTEHIHAKINKAFMMLGIN